MAITLKRKKQSEKIEKYVPPMYPSFSVCSREGINLNLDEEDIGKTLVAKIKLSGFNTRKNSRGTNEKDWSFDIQSIDI